MTPWNMGNLTNEGWSPSWGWISPQESRRQEIIQKTNFYSCQRIIAMTMGDLEALFNGVFFSDIEDS